MIELNIGRLLNKIKQIENFNKFHILGVDTEVEMVLFIPDEDEDKFVHLLQDIYGEANDLAIKIAFKEKEVPQDNNLEEV